MFSICLMKIMVSEKIDIANKYVLNITIAHSRIDSTSSYGRNICSYGSILERFCSKCVACVVTNINICCLFREMAGKKEKEFLRWLYINHNRKTQKKYKVQNLNNYLFLTLVSMAASRTVHFSACWKGPAVWTTRSASALYRVKYSNLEIYSSKKS